MHDIIDYAEQERASFGEVPLGAVDSLLFSQLCYLRFGEAFPDTEGPIGRALHDCFHMERFEQLYLGQRDEDENHRLLAAVAASPRYRDVRVCRHVAQTDIASETQFSATAFVLPGDAGVYAAFRGTDSTLVGWKENFNMAYRYPVPGQVSACLYLNKLADATGGPLFVGGHSKGGNLAVYASTQCDASAQDRIVEVFDHDGPGFRPGFYRHSAFTRLEGRISKTMPENAVVGTLMDTLEDYRVVQSDGVALMQHDPFTWSVDIGARDFAIAEGLSRAAGWGDAVISEWVDSVDPQRRGVFVDTLFAVLAATGAHTMGDLAHVGTQELRAAADVLREADPDTRKVVLEVLGRLARAVMPSASPKAQPNGRAAADGRREGGVPAGGGIQAEAGAVPGDDARAGEVPTVDSAEGAWRRLRDKMLAFMGD